MHPDDFSSHSSGSLEICQSDPICFAFKPYPLPPDLSLDLDLFNALSQASLALGELAGLGRNIPNPNLLIRPFIRREAVLSLRIEGTQTDIADVYAYEDTQLTLPSSQVSSIEQETNVFEVLNYIRALDYGLSKLKELPVCLRLIKDLHEKLMEGVRGEFKAPGQFRKCQNWIGGRSIEVARFIPPIFSDMEECLRELESYINCQCLYPPLIRIAFIHYQFETIHPFMDGNGRIGRLLIALLLLDWDLLPLPLLYLSAYFEKHKNEYCNLMLAVSQKSLWKDWVLFFLKGIEEQSKDAVQRAKSLQDLQQQWRSQARLVGGSSLLSPLVDFLFETPIVTIPQVRDRFNVAYTTAQQNIEKLVATKILYPVDETYNKRFVAIDVLRVIDQPNL
jgi:Fic family protein